MQCVERSLSTTHNKFLQWLHGKQQEHHVQYFNELRGLGLVKYSFCRSFASQNIEVHHDKVDIFSGINIMQNTMVRVGEWPAGKKMKLGVR